MRPPLFLYAALAVALLTMAGVSFAKPLTYALPEETSTLRPGLDVEAAQNNCLSCHSVDYVITQPPHRGKAFWDAEVTKMIKVYHAPISDADAKATLRPSDASTRTAAHLGAMRQLRPHKLTTQRPVRVV